MGFDEAQGRLCGPGAPFELVSVPTADSDIRNFRHAPRTLGELYARAGKAATRVAATAGSRSITYGTLFSSAVALSGSLHRDFHVAGGTRVALVLGNRFEWLITFVAVTSLGGVAVLVDPRRGRQEIGGCLQTTECQLAVVEEELAAELAERGEPRPLIVSCSTPGRRLPAGMVALQELLHSCPGPTSPIRLEPEQEAVIAFTSGSTGAPKGVLLDHRGLITGVFNMLLGGYLLAARNRRGQQGSAAPAHATVPASLLLSPLAHVAGYSQFLLMCVLGGKLVLRADWDAEAILEVASRERIRTLVGATPAQIRELLRAGNAPTQLSSVARLSFHGEELQESLIQEITEVLPSVIVGAGYGMTETNGSICVTGGAELRQRPSTCGPPLPTAQVRIVTEEGQLAAAGQTGEILVRGSMLARGYCAGGALSPPFLQAGWFRTGDLGAYDRDGFLHVLTRADQWVLWGDRKIATRDLEQAVRLCAQVEEVVALSLVGPTGRGRPAIIIVTRRGNTLDTAAVGEALAHEFSMQESRPVVIGRSALERTPSGKVDRRRLLRLVAEMTHG